jgi:hypothetical protein
VVKWPKGIIGCKWVLHIKKNAAGEIEKYQARLVVHSFMQIHGVNYYKTYIPIARLVSFRLLITMANQNNWSLESFDLIQPTWTQCYQMIR